MSFFFQKQWFSLSFTLSFNFPDFNYEIIYID